MLLLHALIALTPLFIYPSSSLNTTDLNLAVSLAFPSPSVTCAYPIVTRSISYPDCRLALAHFRQTHPKAIYRITEGRPLSDSEIGLTYKTVYNTCEMVLDYATWLPLHNPIVIINFLDRWGNRLARQCVQNNHGGGGSVGWLDIDESIYICLRRIGSESLGCRLM